MSVGRVCSSHLHSTTIEEGCAWSTLLVLGYLSLVLVAAAEMLVRTSTTIETTTPVIKTELSHAVMWRFVRKAIFSGRHLLQEGRG